MNLQGSIDLLKLEKTGVVTLKGKRCVIIPIEENDIYITADQQTQKATHAYLGLDVLERREPNQYGKTHYAKQSLSKGYREQHPAETDAKKSVYLGDFKPLAFETNNQAAAVQAPVMQADEDDLPF